MRNKTSAIPEEHVMPFPPTQPRLGPVTTKPSSPSPRRKTRQLLLGFGPAASPSIRKRARDLGIDLTKVRGTARGGRIVPADLLDHIALLETMGGQDA